MRFRPVRRLRPVGHDEQVSLVDHLDELRTRLIVSLLTLAVAFAVCFWQNQRLLSLVDQPLAAQTQAQVRAGHGPLGATYTVQRSSRDVALQLRTVVRALKDTPQPPGALAMLDRVDRSLRTDVKQLSAPPEGNRPVTLGIGEPFTTTVTVTLIFALILVLPMLLVQAYAYLGPALEPEFRKRTRSLLPAVPILFIAGVAFGYFGVLPAALHFFQNFNSSQFNVLVQASQYYKFAATTLLVMGLLFQLPLAILIITRSGLVTTRRLRRSRRHAVAACALLAALLPGDAITMLVETVPLYLLFEISLLVAVLAERRARRVTGVPAADPVA
jgi:sec-independent protein translocase protein TatC